MSSSSPVIGVEGGELGIVHHDVVEEDDHLLHQHQVECDEDLDNVRQSAWFWQYSLDCGQ